MPDNYNDYNSYWIFHVSFNRCSSIIMSTWNSYLEYTIWHYNRLLAVFYNNFQLWINIYTIQSVKKGRCKIFLKQNLIRRALKKKILDIFMSKLGLSYLPRNLILTKISEHFDLCVIINIFWSKFFTILLNF